MYAEYLTFEGFDVLEAHDGQEAVACARASSPDAVVLDVGLPVLDGIEATKMLRADDVTRRMVVVALSGHGHEMEERAVAAGIDRFCRKPCLPEVLVAHLRELLASPVDDRSRL